MDKSLHNDQMNYLRNVNQLHRLQQKIAFYELHDEYQPGYEAFQEYLIYLKRIDQPFALIALYLRFAKYCLKFEEKSLARDLYNEAQSLYTQISLNLDKMPSEMINQESLQVNRLDLSPQEQ